MFFLEMNGYLLALTPKKAKCKSSKLYFTGNAHAKEEFGNLQEIFKDQNSIVNG
jgi:hypothetical protein